ncbi:hypothetical protein [Myroides guanonis]|uniref:Uncharacterized protein n=1 Tax=Myroides guanonis TaxID=1150112 RepID=A0A1I3QV56_9FLAO|nr:hypothetical protein [Myroides guanonis]SFJ37620.1 hypothetical protein SAMN04487893_106133 [Myroides guanonis]
MSELNQIIDSIEIKFAKLIQKLSALESSNNDLKKRLLRTEETLKEKEKDLTVLQTKYESLKLASSLLGSDENKRDTKLKINSLIREIDQCIVQLSK